MKVSRGLVYWATLDDIGRKPWLVVSNNARHAQLKTCLAVRITTTQKPELASIVKMAPLNAPTVGSALCDDIAVMNPEDDKFEYFAALTPQTMVRVDAGLRAARALH